jgi:hypothetical protein
MKKLLVFLIVLFFGLARYVPCSDYFFTHSFAYEVTDGIGLLVENGVATLFKYFPQHKKDYWQEFRRADLRYGSDGFARLSCFGTEAVVVLGGNHMMLHFPQDPSFSMYKPGRDLSGQPGVWRKQHFRVAEVTASSIFSEIVRGATVRYTPRNLTGIFLIDAMGIERVWNHQSLPWVEGEDGPGIGSRLEVRFAEPVDHMLVLNGFVDLSRKHLYKMNSRAERVRISSLDPNRPFAFVYEFEDKVKFHYLPFPKSVKKVRLEILEVYPGSRWQDTSISAILTNRTYDRYEEGILQRFKAQTEPYHAQHQ